MCLSEAPFNFSTIKVYISHVTIAAETLQREHALKCCICDAEAQENNAL